METTNDFDIIDDEYEDYDDSWDPSDDYPTKKSWEEDMMSMMFPDGPDDGLYLAD